MVSSDTLLWLAPRVGIPVFAFVALLGVFAIFLFYPRIKRRNEITTDPLMSKKRVFPFYSSMGEERPALKVSRKPRTKHLRSFSAQLTPPTKYSKVRHSPNHRHFRRNSSPTMSRYNSSRRESPCESPDTAAPKVKKLLEAFSLFHVQPPPNLQLESHSKKYVGSPVKSRHLISRAGHGQSNLATTSQSNSLPQSEIEIQPTNVDEKDQP